MRRDQRRGKLPLLVGGTMLYFKALRDGLDDLPRADPALRAELDAEAAESACRRCMRGWPHSTRHRRPPETQRRQRIQRALEIIRADRPADVGAAGQGAQRPNCRSACCRSRWNRPTARAACAHRRALRCHAGRRRRLAGRSAALRARGDLHPGLPSMRCVGYRQAWEYLDGEIDRATLRDTGIVATRQLAKRQLTWLRSMPDGS